MTEVDNNRRQRGNSRLPLVIGVAVIIVIAGIWYFGSRDGEAPPETAKVTAPEPKPAAEEPPPEPAPDIPRPEPAPAPEPEPEPLPPLPESDPAVRQELRPLSESDRYEQWLETENLIQKTVTVAEGMSRGVLLRKVIPMSAPEQPFQVSKEDGTMVIAESSYDRYDPLVETLVSIEPRPLANAFHKFRPLLEEAYGELGRPEEDMDNTLIRAIDRVLATPEVEEPIELVRESVYYQFADPRLESLPPIQKQMLRLGPENREKIKRYLREVRAALVAQEADAGE
jgi:hypothetical protein